MNIFQEATNIKLKYPMVMGVKRHRHSLIQAFAYLFRASIVLST